VHSAQGSINDISTLTQANNETQKLVNSIKRISLLGNGSKETIQIFAPNGSQIGCYTDGNVGFVVKINQKINDQESTNPTSTLCPNNICDKNFELPNINITCSFNTPQPGTRIFIIEKENNSIKIYPGS